MKDSGFFHKLRSNMSFNMIGAIVLLLAVFGAGVCALGYACFTNAFKNEYAVSTYHMADTAATLINGDHIDDYLAGNELEEYRRTKELLDAYCKKMHVSLIYLIDVDRNDYGRFVSVFNCVNNTVDDTSYQEWELGHKRDTTNDEYRNKYRALYAKEALYETVYRLKPPDGLHPHVTTMVPVSDSGGDVVSILCFQRPIRELQDARRPYVITVVISTVVLAFLFSCWAFRFIKLHFVLPIRKVSDEATRFARENTKGDPLGEISNFKELSNLAASIDTMETDMVNYIDNLTAATAERERFSAEMSLATTIQENSLPNTFPAFPDRTEFDVYASMDPAREVGGDFYNYFFIDDDHLAFLIGDVSGKGVPGALFMMVTNILLRDRTHIGGTPEEILTIVNDTICASNKAEMFVTVWLGILEVSTGKLKAANAGHEYPVLKKPDGGFELIKDRHGFVIGGLEGAKYRGYELLLEPGAKLFLYTDGVPEATNKENEMFGTQRMLDALNAEPGGTPEQLLNNVRLAVDGFVKDAEQFDDLTMLCLQYLGPKQSNT